MAQEKIAVVTGSSSGIGLLTAWNWRGAVIASSPPCATGSAAIACVMPPRRPGCADRLDLRQLDITQHDSLAGAVEGIVRDHRRIDVLVNNAGFSSAGFAEDMSLAEIRDQMETNFFGNVAMTKAVLPVMRRQRSGHIILVTSVAGRIGQPMLSGYSASKFALEGWSEALRIEVHSLGIRVAVVEPGSYQTDIWRAT